MTGPAGDPAGREAAWRAIHSWHKWAFPHSELDLKADPDYRQLVEFVATAIAESRAVPAATQVVCTHCGYDAEVQASSPEPASPPEHEAGARRDAVSSDSGSADYAHKRAASPPASPPDEPAGTPASSERRAGTSRLIVRDGKIVKEAGHASGVDPRELMIRQFAGRLMVRVEEHRARDLPLSERSPGSPDGHGFCEDYSCYDLEEIARDLLNLLPSDVTLTVSPTPPAGESADARGARPEGGAAPGASEAP